MAIDRSRSPSNATKWLYGDPTIDPRDVKARAFFHLFNL